MMVFRQFTELADNAFDLSGLNTPGRVTPYAHRRRGLEPRQAAPAQCGRRTTTSSTISGDALATGAIASLSGLLGQLSSAQAQPSNVASAVLSLSGLLGQLTSAAQAQPSNVASAVLSLSGLLGNLTRTTAMASTTTEDVVLVPPPKIVPTPVASSPADFGFIRTAK